MIAAVLGIYFVMVLTRPTDDDYRTYLYKEHGVCFNIHEKCIQAQSEHMLTLPIYMTAETQISEEQEIRVFGIFNHFFIRKNSIKS
ncbi:hypothetical protein MU1_36840 [Paenibacillus glycanilyticus]|uniref:Uncharacterized protein n=1 Tax=Paenibacillus glycanilyticus TaxID=126569 RepID=A0ABQ6GED4_9BACL|nr:hypothetical protein MU1_36840 [Paenibacillus glycanilyticus]